MKKIETKHLENFDIVNFGGIDKNQYSHFNTTDDVRFLHTHEFKNETSLNVINYGNCELNGELKSIINDLKPYSFVEEKQVGYIMGSCECSTKIKIEIAVKEGRPTSRIELIGNKSCPLSSKEKKISRILR